MTEGDQAANLHPDAVAVARASAEAAGLSVEEWLSRTILDNAGSGVGSDVPVDPPRQNGTPVKQDPLAVLERQLRIAEKAAHAAHMSIDQWLSRAILSAIQGQEQDVKPIRPAGPPVPAPTATAAPAAKFREPSKPAPTEPTEAPVEPEPESQTAPPQQATPPQTPVQPEEPAKQPPARSRSPEQTVTAAAHGLADDDEHAFEDPLEAIAAALDVPSTPPPEPETTEPVDMEDRLARIVQAARQQLDHRPEPTIDEILSPPESGPAISLDPATGGTRRRLGAWLAAALLAILAVIAAAIWIAPRLTEMGVQVTPALEKPGRVKLPPSSGRSENLASRTPETIPAPNAEPAKRSAAEPPTKATAKRPQPPSAYVDWYTRAAQSGDVDAQATIARLYFFGDGVPRDYEKAAHWFAAAADAGNVDAQYAMGVLLESGLGVDQDPAKALEWYEIAAAAGHLESLNNTGVAYFLGEVVTQDYARAFAAFRTAAEAGLPEAQFNLAQMYQQGRGIGANPVFAYKWYALALAGGEDRARKELDRLTTQMKDQDIARARKLIDQFQPN